MTDARVASRAVAVRRNDLPRWTSAAGKILLVASFATMLSAPSVAPFPAFPLLFMGFLLLVAVSYVASFARVPSARLVEVRGGELAIERGRRVPISRVVSALVVVRDVYGASAPYVEIELPPRGALRPRETRGDLVSVRVRDEPEGDALVDALGFGRGGRRVRAHLELPSRRLLHLPLALVAYMAGGVTMALVVAALAAIGMPAHGGGPVPEGLAFASLPIGALFWHAVLKRLARAPRVVVGDDGVVVEGALRRRKIPRAAIADVSLRGASVTPFFRLGDGKLVSLHGAALDGERRLAIARLARERACARASEPVPAVDLARAGRGAHAWREALRQRAENPSYRAAASTHEAMSAVLASPAAAPEQRVGAALALRVAGEPPERIRVAAEALVDDATRAALEAVAADDDAKLDAALRRLSPGDKAR